MPLERFPPKMTYKAADQTDMRGQITKEFISRKLSMSCPETSVVALSKRFAKGSEKRLNEFC